MSIFIKLQKFHYLMEEVALDTRYFTANEQNSWF